MSIKIIFLKYTILEIVVFHSLVTKKSTFKKYYLSHFLDTLITGGVDIYRHRDTVKWTITSTGHDVKHQTVQKSNRFYHVIGIHLRDVYFFFLSLLISCSLDPFYIDLHWIVPEFSLWLSNSFGIKFLPSYMYTDIVKA